MTLQDALNMFKLPYKIVSTNTAAGFTTYILSPTAAGATINRLQTRINDLRVATGEKLELIQDDNGLCDNESRDLLR